MSVESSIGIKVLRTVPGGQQQETSIEKALGVKDIMCPGRLTGYWMTLGRQPSIFGKNSTVNIDAYIKNTIDIKVLMCLATSRRELL